MATSQLLILGNGFDLHCGLKSSYKDFFGDEIIDATSEPFGLKQLQVGVDGFWENLLLEYYISNPKGYYNWCDIEEIIKNTLLSICFGKNISEANINDGLYSKAALHYTLKSRLFDNADLDTIERFVFKCCVNFTSKIRAVPINYFIGQLLNDLKKLEKRFCKYLKNQLVNPNNEKELNTNYIVKAVNLLGKLTDFSTSTYNNTNNIIHQEYREVEEKTGPNSARVCRKAINVLSQEFNGLRATNILSFNYTALFDILNVESPCNYNNVHGKLCNNICGKHCDNSTIIFGIDDNIIQSQGSNSELRLFSKTYRKMHLLGNPSNILPPNTGNPIEIKFYGHSLSEADYSYFQSIFDYYDLYGNSNVSLIFYYSKGYEQHDAIYKLISEYGKSLTNKEQGKNLIHKLLLENRLKIQEIRD